MKFGKSSDLLWTYASFILKGFSFFMIAPVAARNLGEDEWSKVLVAQALANWMSIIIDYGYSLSYGSKNYSEGGQISEVASGILLSRAIISFIVISLLVLLDILGAFNFNALFIISIVFLSVGQGFSNTWFFQAHGRMKIISKIDVLCRSLSLILSYAVIIFNGPGWSIIGIIGISLIASNLISGQFMIKVTGKLSLDVMKSFNMMKVGFGAAFFTAFTSIYTSAALVMYSFSATSREIAIYGNADRLFRATSSLISPLNQVIMPKSVNIIQSDRLIRIKYYTSISVLYIIFSLVLAGVVVLFSGNIIGIIYGKDYGASSNVLKFLSLGIIMISFNTVIAYHIMIARGYIKHLNVIYMFTSMLFVISSIFTVASNGIEGMVMSTLLPEAVALTLLVAYVVIYRKKIL